MNVRKASIEDLPNIFNLERLVWKNDSATQESLRIRINKFPEGFSVVYDNNQLVGMAMSALLPKNHQVKEYDEAFFPWERIHNPKGEILYLYCSTVHPDFRGKGIWKKMLDFRVDYAKSHQEIEKIWVTGRTEPGEYGHDTATPLERFGFKRVKDFPFQGHCTQRLLELLQPYSLRLSSL